MPNPIKRGSMKDKKPRILNRSRSRSYGKKGPHQRFTRRKQRAIEPARVREAKLIENVTPTETKIPWRAPRSKPDRSKPDGCSVGCCMCIGLIILPFAIMGFYIDIFFGLFFFSILFIVLPAIEYFMRSYGGW